MLDWEGELLRNAECTGSEEVLELLLETVDQVVLGLLHVVVHNHHIEDSGGGRERRLSQDDADARMMVPPNVTCTFNFFVCVCVCVV